MLFPSSRPVLIQNKDKSLYFPSLTQAKEYIGLKYNYPFSADLKSTHGWRFTFLKPQHDIANIPMYHSPEGILTSAPTDQQSAIYSWPIKAQTSCWLYDFFNDVYIRFTDKQSMLSFLKINSLSKSKIRHYLVIRPQVYCKYICKNVQTGEYTFYKQVEKKIAKQLGWYTTGNLYLYKNFTYTNNSGEQYMYSFNRWLEEPFELCKGNFIEGDFL